MTSLPHLSTSVCSPSRWLLHTVSAELFSASASCALVRASRSDVPRSCSDLISVSAASMLVSLSCALLDALSIW
eukprot:CAMPEP_0202883824 /NCGR_PEP_ID=MMETSP1391-20130828/40039_1 /ASSEMBLY_ACC=CAM_ASM_000867 /TAXON_ID=1034604 /ORGANISM="Chlamydomonas leiostraca, Strain SAG 11-49" /LENGTH=73 /DNA_ID=CAMNT_0049566907 /DNA_START=649 /DNA_END=867 /DNA_ORIENTATION=-